MPLFPYYCKTFHIKDCNKALFRFTLFCSVFGIENTISFSVDIKDDSHDLIILCNLELLQSDIQGKQDTKQQFPEYLPTKLPIQSCACASSLFFLLRKHTTLSMKGPFLYSCFDLSLLQKSLSPL